MAATTDDFPASTATTAQLLLNTPSSGNFETFRDEDWFRFHADAGQHYQFSTSLDQTYWPPALAIYDASGKLVSDASGQNFEPAQSGDYYLSATGYATTNYSVTLQVRQDDYSGNNSAPGWLSPGIQSNGIFEYKQDIDRFQFSAVAGQVYRFDARLLDDTANQPSITFYDADGHALSASFDNGPNGVISGWVMAQTTGIYAVNMQLGWYANGNHYSITEAAVTADDHGGTLATATPLTLGAITAGALQSPADVDYFSVQLGAGTTYTISTLLSADNPNASLSAQFQGPGGGYLPGLGGQRTFSYTPATSGTYYLNISGYSAQLPGYTVSVSQTPDDYGATLGAAGRLVVDGAGTPGVLDAGGGDRDWFTVSLDAGQTYWVQLANPPAGTHFIAGYATMNILDAGGTLLATTANTNFRDGNRIVPFVPSVKGSYVIEVAGEHDGQGGDYQVTVKHGQVDDVGNDAAHAATLALDAFVSGNLELSTDKDVYKLHVDAGNVYRISAQGVGGDAGWINAIALGGGSSNSSGWLDQLPNGYSRHDNLYKATATGDLYITVTQNASYNAVQTGSYTLHAISYGQDDFPQGSQGLSTLAVGGQIQGAVNYPGDADSFTVHLEAGRSYAFDLQGALSGAGTLDATSATLSLYGTQGVTATRLTGGEARLSCVVNATGDYQISVLGDGSHLGSYTLHATQASGDLTAPTLTTPADVNVVGWPGKFTLQFSESVMPGSGSFALKDSNGKVFAPHGYKITAASNQIFVDVGGNLAPGETYTLSLAPDSVLDLAGNHLSGPVSVRFHTAPMAIQGTAGDDLLVGHLNGAHIDGGAGLDTVYYAHSWYQFDTTRGANNDITVQQSGTQGGDVLTGVERIMLQDQAIALDINGAAGQAYRLYKAAFDRIPDYAGLGYWINAIDHGVSLQAAAHSFAMSAEFQAKYGAALTDAQYLDQLYHNVLHRAGDAGGISYWLDAMQHGQSRDTVLTFFSESPENQAAVIGQIQNGIGYTPFG